MRFGLGKTLIALLLLALAACSKPVPAQPALWLVEGPDGQKAWLLATRSLLSKSYDWNSGKVDTALRQSDRLFVDELYDDQTYNAAKAYARLSPDGSHRPLSDRVSPDMRPALKRIFDEIGLLPDEFDQIRIWAAAFQLARETKRIDQTNGSSNKEIQSNYKGKILPFERSGYALALADALPDAQQLNLLRPQLIDPAGRKAHKFAMEQAWSKGDLDGYARMLTEENFGDQLLMDSMIFSRSRIWVDRIVASMRGREHPLVALSMDYLVGPQGLPALLTAKGYKVTRLQ